MVVGFSFTVQMKDRMFSLKIKPIFAFRVFGSKILENNIKRVASFFGETARFFSLNRVVFGVCKDFVVDFA